MNSRFDVETIMRSFPRILDEDVNQNALGTAVASLMVYLHPDLEEAGIYNRIDELPEDLCDILAYDLKIDWYDYNTSLSAKRNLIKTSFEVHRHLGTTGAVNRAIQAVYPQSNVEEWWEDWYQGEPYHFRVVLEAAFPVVPFNKSDIYRAVYIYKSLRSHLDGIIFRSTNRFVIKTKCRWIIYNGRKCGTYPQVMRYGSIEDHGIIIWTHNDGQGYMNPRTGQLNAGTFPLPAVPGGLEDERIIIHTSNPGIVYRNPMTNELASGEFPAPSEIGQLSPEELELLYHVTGTVYHDPNTNEIMSGEHPNLARTGTLNSGDIDAHSVGDGLDYDFRVCGSDPGSLF